jgi:hypothetical protein
MNKKSWSLVAICACLILSFAAYQLLYAPMTNSTSSGTDDYGTSNVKDQTTATPSTTSTQYSILVNFRTAYSAQTLIHIETSTGSNILTFKPTKQFQSIAFCSPSLTNGSTYNIYVGGSSTGTLKDCIYSNGVYTPGTKYTSLTINSIVTTSRW